LRWSWCGHTHGFACQYEVVFRILPSFRNNTGVLLRRFDWVSQEVCPIAYVDIACLGIGVFLRERSKVIDRRADCTRSTGTALNGINELKGSASITSLAWITIYLITKAFKLQQIPSRCHIIIDAVALLYISRRTALASGICPL